MDSTCKGACSCGGALDFDALTRRATRPGQWGMYVWGAVRGEADASRLSQGSQCCCGRTSKLASDDSSAFFPCALPFELIGLSTNPLFEEVMPVIVASAVSGLSLSSEGSSASMPVSGQGRGGTTVGGFTLLYQTGYRRPFCYKNGNPH